MAHLNRPPGGTRLRLEGQVLGLALGRHPASVASVEEQKVLRAAIAQSCAVNRAGYT